MCLNIMPGVLFAVAETRTTSIVAGIINALTPLTTLFFILVVFRDEPMQRYQFVGLGVDWSASCSSSACGRASAPIRGGRCGPTWRRHSLWHLVSLHPRRFLIPRRHRPRRPWRAPSSCSRPSRCCRPFSSTARTVTPSALQAVLGDSGPGDLWSGFAYHVELSRSGRGREVPSPARSPISLPSSPSSSGVHLPPRTADVV